MKMSTLQKNLKKVRKSLGLTQRDISSKLNMSTNTYNGYESQGKLPNAGFIKDFCNTFNISADWLLGLNANKNMPLSVADVYYFIKHLEENNVYCDSFSLWIDAYIAPETANAITIVIDDENLYKFYQTNKLMRKSPKLYVNPDEYKDWYSKEISRLSEIQLEDNQYSDAYQKMFNDISKNYYINENVEYLDGNIFDYYDDKLHKMGEPDEDNNKQDDNEQDDD